MRLLTLDLERYGPFTGRSLAFREDAALHVVYGPNEAGKSSALAAITDLLFGIEERTRYDFKHRGPEMRLGATILARDGRALAFRRRKGRKNTLFAGETPLPDDALAGFLGGLTRDVFGRAFGIDAGALRAGGDDMLKADGELGAAIFAAASGLRGYSDLVRTLEDEAAAIFTPRARDRPLNKALSAHEDLVRAARAEKLGADAWRDLAAGFESATQGLERIAARRGAIAADLTRLRRLRRVAPLVAEIDAMTGALERSADLPERAEAEIATLGVALDTRAAAAKRLAEATAARDALVRDLDDAPADDHFARHAEAIASAFRDVGSYAKASSDLPRVAAEVEEFERGLAALAARAGLAGVADLAARQPSDADRARVEQLIGEGREIKGAVMGLETARADEARELDRLARRRAEAREPLDPAPFRARLDAFAPGLRDAQRADDLLRDITRESKALDAAAARMSPPVAGIEALAAAALPSRETIQRLETEARALARARQTAADRLARAQTLVEEIGERLRARQGERAVPTRDALLAARAGRDAAWALVRAAALGVTDAPRGGDLLDALARHERLRDEADATADTLTADAARVADHAADTRRLVGAEADREAALAETRALAERAEAAEAAWRALWAPAGVEPLAPADMAAWLAGVPMPLERHAALRDRRVEHALLADKIAALRGPLVTLADEIGAAAVEGSSLVYIAHAVAERLRVLGDIWDANRDGEARVASLREALALTQTRLAAARAAQAAWAGRWDDAMPALGLAPGVSIPEAEAALGVWRAVPDAVRERDNRAGRVAGMRRDLQAFDEVAAPLVEALAPDLAGLRAPDAITLLHERMREAQKAAARRAEIARRHAKASRDRDLALAADAAAETALRAAASRAGAPDEGAIAAAAFHDRLIARRDLLKARQARRDDLAVAGDGVAEEVLRADLAATSIDAIEALAIQLADEDARLDLEGKKAFSARVEIETRRKTLENGMGAEMIVARRRALEAEIRDAARRHAVLRIASGLLAAGLAAQRGRRQDPLFDRAGALFAGLTGGAFSGLAQEFDDADTPRVAGLRAGGGPPVRIAAMSEGTRDQLYLALRLAYIEDYGRHAEPAPFVGDDLFATFDDARTAHGLRALAAIGGGAQPILFTHHEHVAAIARRDLGAAVDIIALD